MIEREVPLKGERPSPHGEGKVKKWLVSVNYEYYPSVEEFDTYKEALEQYKREVECAKDEAYFTHDVYLSEVATEYKNKEMNN